MRNPGKTLGDFVDGRVNNFDLLRLFAALLVLVSHSLVLAGEPLEPLVRLFGGYRTLVSVYMYFSLLVVFSLLDLLSEGRLLNISQVGFFE